MSKRTKEFRYLRLLLECGCEVAESTSFYKLDKRRLANLLGAYARTGVWCFKHPGMNQVIEFLGTCSEGQSRV